MRTEDGYIIQQCLDGDSAAFGLLVDKYKKSIYALAYSRISNFHDAQDITQEVFIKAYQELRTLRRWDNFMGWLYRITANQCKNWIRSSSRRPDGEFTEDQEPYIVERTSVDSYREDMVYESVREALDSLPETYRDVMTLRYFGGMTVREISRFIGVPPRTIDRRLREARIRLKDEMVATMSATYEQHELPVDFTFRIIEIVKRIKIHAMPRSTGLPWGLSLAAGIAVVVMTLGSQVAIHQKLTHLMLPSETETLKAREMSVDILSAPGTSLTAVRQGNIDGAGMDQRSPQDTSLPAPALGGGTWTQKADMPTGRMLLSTSTVNGKIYAIGGAPRGAQQGTLMSSVSTVEEYDPATNTWRTKAHMPTARFGLSTSVFNGRIYAIGGAMDRPQVPSSTVEEYDPAMDTWTTKADMPTARWGLSTSVVNGRIYAIGGFPRDSHNKEYDPMGSHNTSTVEEYDPATDTWTRKADMTTARFGLSTSVVNGRIYAFGGARNCVTPAFLTVEEYDPATDTWRTKADIPTIRLYLSTSAVNGKIYAIGGTGLACQGKGGPLWTVEEYDPATDTWRTKTHMPMAKVAFSASAVDGKIYAIGGSLAGYPWAPAPTVEEYDTGFVPSITEVSNMSMNSAARQ
jgi:RNA polymerase sigma factor (sigma-70 family)